MEQVQLWLEEVNEAKMLNRAAGCLSLPVTTFTLHIFTLFITVNMQYCRVMSHIFVWLSCTNIFIERMSRVNVYRNACSYIQHSLGGSDRFRASVIN